MAIKRYKAEQIVTLLLNAVSASESGLWLPKIPSDLKTQGFGSFVRSWWLPR